MSRLVDFYRGKVTNTEGRRLADIWSWDDEELEFVHDYIQWLFPLTEPSQFNPDAPLLTADDIAAFQTDPGLQTSLRRSFDRILAFLGLALTEEGQVVEGPNFAARAAGVWAAPNHNWLRVTRILYSLVLLGMALEARALYDWLAAAYTSRKYPISAETFWYWTEAVGR